MIQRIRVAATADGIRAVQAVTVPPAKAEKNAMVQKKNGGLSG